VVDRSNDLLWAVSRNSGEVYAISLSSLTLVDHTPVGHLPFGAALLDGVLYVANFADGSLSRLRAAERASLPDIAVGDEPSWVAADPVTGRVWVTLHGASGVAVVVDGRVSRRIYTGQGAFAVAVDAGRRLVYVGNRDSRDVVVLNADSGDRMRTLEPGGSPFAMAVNPATGALYVVHGGPAGGCPADRMAIYAANGMRLRDVPVGDTCDGGWVETDPESGRVYVAATAAGQVRSFEWDGAPIAVFGAAHGVGSEPLGLAMDAPTARLFVGNRADDSITVLTDP